MSDIMDFEKFGKIPRLSREVVVTEKIDGTNGQILIVDPLSMPEPEPAGVIVPTYTNAFMLVGSRTRWLTHEADNYGFWHWAYDNRDELIKLGEGRHFGEWWGSKIQRGYGLTNGERHFSLFNTGRWVDRQIGNVTYIGDGAVGSVPKQGQQFAPVCCRVVPILYTGEFDTESIEFELHDLRCNGSRAAPGYMNPEGVVIFHTAANMSFKKTLEKDEKPKGSAE